jgi:hypothetical protein
MDGRPTPLDVAQRPSHPKPPHLRLQVPLCPLHTIKRLWCSVEIITQHPSSIPSVPSSQMLSKSSSLASSDKSRAKLASESRRVFWSSMDPLVIFLLAFILFSALLYQVLYSVI